MKRIISLVLALLIVSSSLTAQKIQTVSGDYTYILPETQSYDDAKRVALYRAKIQILADTYGTVMNMTSATIVGNTDSGSYVDMFSLGESYVKGEWIETIGEPEYKMHLSEDGTLAITVYVTGRVRAVSESKADYAVKVLRNGTEDKYESTDFREGDDMFLSFTSPADGYVVIYLYDGTDSMYCLLPYQQQKSHSVRTEAGVRYVFFSIEDASDSIDESVVDEYTLTCERSVEVNRIYVIWSPNEFYKSVDSIKDDLLPREIGYKTFQKWLASLQIHDEEVVVKTVDITISKITE